MTYISIDCSYCFLVGRICPLMQAHFLWPLLKRKAFLLRMNKGSNFLQSAFWIWITKRFSLVRECNVFLQCCITLDPARQFSLQNVKSSRIVSYRSKIIRVNCSLNWSYINLVWRIELLLSKLQLSVFQITLEIMRYYEKMPKWPQTKQLPCNPSYLTQPVDRIRTSVHYQTW